MATLAEYSDRVFKTARAGTPTNPDGLPPVLAALVVAQARHESNDFRSNHFKDSNNAFGYSWIQGAKWQIGPGGIADNNKPVAKYASLEDSVKEIVDYIYRRKKEGKFPDLSTITTPEQYAALLKKVGYYGDTLANYSKRLRELFDGLPSIAGFGIMFLAAIIFWLIYKLSSKNII